MQYYLTEDDVRFLRTWIAHMKSRGPAAANRSHDNFTEHQEHQAPEIYVARPPSGGIPARTEEEPGQAECVIYRIYMESGTPRLRETGMGDVLVFNLSTDDIPEDSYVLVVRDKYGEWYAVTGGGSGGFMLAKVVARHGGSPPRYTCVKIRLRETAPNSGVLEFTSYGDNLPNCFRAPSMNFEEPVGLPKIPVGQSVLLRKTPTAVSDVGTGTGDTYEITAWGGQIRYKRKVLVDVECDNGTLVKIFRYERWNARDFCISPGVVGEA